MPGPRFTWEHRHFEMAKARLARARAQVKVANARIDLADARWNLVSGQERQEQLNDGDLQRV